MLSLACFRSKKACCLLENGRAREGKAFGALRMQNG